MRSKRAEQLACGRLCNRMWRRTPCTNNITSSPLAGAPLAAGAPALAFRSAFGGPLQIEVLRCPSADMMIPTVGEQDTANIQEQGSDRGRSFHSTLQAGRGRWIGSSSFAGCRRSIRIGRRHHCPRCVETAVPAHCRRKMNLVSCGFPI